MVEAVLLGESRMGCSASTGAAVRGARLVKS
jgi:hypothetical protein